MKEPRNCKNLIILFEKIGEYARVAKATIKKKNEESGTRLQEHTCKIQGNKV